MYKIVLEETLLDYPSPTDDAVAVIFRGCEHNCPNCHSKKLQIPDEYAETNEVFTARLVDFCKRVRTNKIVLLGGDPLYKTNVEITRYITSTLGKDYDICLFTGYPVEYVKQFNLEGVKFYKCGVYRQDLKQISQKNDDEFILASTNQNFYDSNFVQLSKNGILKFKN